MILEKYIATTEEIAEKLIDFCRNGKNIEAIEELFSEKIIRIEPGFFHQERTEGKLVVTGMTLQWLSSIELFYDVYISDPLICGNHFSCAMEFDVKIKGGDRKTLKEICVYEVRNGKIVFEQFFHTRHA